MKEIKKKEHKHKFTLGGFQPDTKYDSPLLFLYCKCGAVEKIIFTKDYGISIEITEPKSL